MPGVDNIQHLLNCAGFDGQWTIAPASEGSSGRTFVARQDDGALFLKLDDANPCGPRLAALGITPPLLARGTHCGSPFSVYAQIAADHPPPAWFADHLPQVIDLIVTCQRDRELAHALDADAPSLPAHLARQVTSLEAAIDGAVSPLVRTPDVRSALHRLAVSVHRGRIDAAPLVPSHTDPNNSNVLVAPERVYLIDWDGIALSDPLRDIGLILWWYVPEARWPEAFARMGIPATDLDATIARVHWWSAVTSLRVALWIDRHAPNDDAIRSFLTDFTAAANDLPNPKRAP